jgi:hypothetical protein
VKGFTLTIVIKCRDKATIFDQIVSHTHVPYAERKIKVKIIISCPGKIVPEQL